MVHFGLNAEKRVAQVSGIVAGGSQTISFIIEQVDRDRPVTSSCQLMAEPAVPGTDIQNVAALRTSGLDRSEDVLQGVKECAASYLPLPSFVAGQVVEGQRGVEIGRGGASALSHSHRLILLNESVKMHLAL